jgi:SAM-dependent methyltransferase
MIKKIILKIVPTVFIKILKKIVMQFKSRKSFIFYDNIIRKVLIHEDFLVKLLNFYYRLKFKREWIWNLAPPHFSSPREKLFDFIYSNDYVHPFSFYRAFYSSEVLKDNDKVLDIGCGDGFFTKRFISYRASIIDAIDIVLDAIKIAKRINFSNNINYLLLNACKDPFPQKLYNVIMLDGVLGHITLGESDFLIKKISKNLASDGIFVGSESLGQEGRDHLQFYYSLEDLFEKFRKYFLYIQLKKIEYPVKFGKNNKNFIRTEAFWRCSNHKNRINNYKWSNFFKE